MCYQNTSVCIKAWRYKKDIVCKQSQMTKLNTMRASTIEWGYGSGCPWRVQRMNTFLCGGLGELRGCFEATFCSAKRSTTEGKKLALAICCNSRKDNYVMALIALWMFSFLDSITHLRDTIEWKDSFPWNSYWVQKHLNYLMKKKTQILVCHLFWIRLENELNDDWYSINTC